MWCMGFYDEAAKVLQRVSTAGLIDMWKCYESIRHSRLWANVRKSQFPQRLAALSIKLYRGPRRILVEKAATAVFTVVQTIVAGDVTATYLLRAIVIPVGDQCVTRVPQARLRIMVDGLSLQVVGAQKW